MKKLRKRIFAAVLAALMMVTAMPATALYASAETETVPDNAIGQAGTEDTEETADGDTEETGTDGAEATGDSDTEEPAQEPPAGPLEDDTAKCICETLCTEDSINGDCPVCGAEGADLSACKGKEQGSVPETDTEDDNADTDTAECICETLCTEDSINGDCPVCGAGGDSLLDCKGKVSEENTGEQEDTGICKHHQEHDDACGYQPASENGEGSPCTYECRICPIEDLIAALPEQVTEDNADDVRAQLDHILDLYRELDEGEQEEIDLSRIYALQGALDAANAPMTADGSTEQQATDEASVTINGETLYYATLEEAFADANRQTATITMLTDAECIKSDSAGSPLNITGGNVTLNLNGNALSGRGYGGYGIIDVSGGSLLVQGEESKVKVARRGLSCRGNGKLTVEGITLELVGDDEFFAGSGIHNEGGTVTLNGTQMTGAASDGQIYHYSGTTTINNVTATGVTENCPKSVWYYNEGTLTINGGTFDKITVDSRNYGGVQSVAELLGEGYTYKKQDGTWATADDLAAMEISNVTVEKIPLTINPQGDTSWYYSTQQTHTLAMNAAPVSSGTVTYVWENGEETLDCTSDAYTVPAGTPVGSYTYTCEATCDGYTLSHTFTFKIEKSGTDLADGKVKTYNGDTQTTTFNADDTITVKATPVATGTTPAKAAARLRSDYTAPTAGQMALFVGDVQVSESVEAEADGIYTMTVSAAEVLLQGNAEQNGNAITLTAKFVGNDNMADAAGTVDVRISAVAMAKKDGEVIGYFGVSNFEGTNNLFCQNVYADATITLLGDVKPGTNSDAGTTCSTMVNITCTLDLAGHNFASTDTAIYVLPGGNLTIQDSSTGKTGNVSFIKSDGTLTLYGGTFGKIETAYTLASLLAENCAYYKGSTPIRLSELADQKELTGPVTVQECQHKDVTPTSNNDGTHTLTCPYCGYTKTAEDCDYGEYTHNDTSHTRICKLCGYQNVEVHNIKCTAEASGTVIAVSEACKTCGYGKDLGTVTIHIPKLVYGDLTGVVTAETTLTEPVTVAGNVKNPLGETTIFSVHAIIDPPTMATLTGDALLSAGEHKIKINIVIIRDENALAECELTFNVDPAPLTADMVTLSAESATYSGTEQKPTLSVQQGETTLTEGTDYEVSYTRDGVVTNDFTNAGMVNITVTGKGNYTGTVTKTFTIGEATPTVTWSNTSQELTYTGNPAVITEPAITLVNNENFKGTISYSYKKEGETAYKDGLPTDAGTYTVKVHVDAAGNYTAADSTNTLTLTINRAQGTLTVPTGPVAKTFGDGQFLLGCSTNGDGKISYASSDENVASVSADGNVLIKGAGEAVITVSLAAGTNYTGAESREVRITVAKAAAPTIPGETRNYTYLNGSHGAVTIDVAGKLPKDRGETTYTAATTDGKGILSGVSMDQDGNLVYTVEANKAIGDTAVITVTAVMANYEDTAYNVTIKLVEKKTVEPQDGGSVFVKDGCILIYGQMLSDLTLENVIFVEQGTQKQVEGTLAWNDPSYVPEVADRTAQWVFTPKDNKEYEQLTGTAAITVVKAMPETEAPEAAAVTYHPAGTLGSVGLNGGSAAWTVGGSAVTVEGTWGWKEPSAIPAVKNSGYTAVFTPEDTANYDTVERTVAVTVAKAEPYIATPPTAAQITYGDTLDASALTGGTVQYSSSDSTAVTGSFAWKDGSIKPDSGSAAYTVVFTPADSADYSSVETQVTLVTGKAENAPDMPPSAMDVARRFEKVGDVGLPEGWQWQDTDRDTALEIGVPVTATAVYTGADRDNYRNVTVSVAITRADCDHEHTEIRNAVTATCQRKGYTGDTWCLDCGELLAKGTETDPADHSGGTATCISGKVCQVCGTEYTGKDGANHMHTEIRGVIKAGCTSDGYTGDIYCTDCGAKTGSGRAVPAAGHDWHVTGEEAATTTSEGRRIYTCGECGQTREESIPKLPQPSHTHSYSPRETKAATCRSNGVVTYSCSCGDSYTQNTAALGHSYRSEVTKQPTISAEGVMTYTCGRCGHSYTRPIAKLPDTGTQQPGTQQPGDTEPGSGSTEETRPDTGIPFIKDEDGKTGWDVIRAEEEKAQEGSTINVDMNGSTVVPGDIFDSIKGKNITVTFDMGDGIIWSVNGKSITIDKAGDIDFSVQTGVNTVPVDIVNNVTGERYSIQISLAYEGEFGFTAVLSIGLGRENAGYTASLYYYNESTGELEFICSDEVAEDGTVSLAFTHASDYVIAIDGEQEEESGNATEPEQPDTPDKDSTGQAEESPQTGQAWRPWWIIVVGALVVIMGIGVFFVVKKGKDGDSGQ